MILIADCGSTKCDWAILRVQSDPDYTDTAGFNPLFHTSEEIVDIIRINDVLSRVAAEVIQIRFFGAGCSEEGRNRRVYQALRSLFPNAGIHVDHDIAGAVEASCGNEPGISCILGTGSNACYFNGEKIIQNSPSLGYILGDEGSGAHLGKRLITDFLYKRMPEELSVKFAASYRTDKEKVIKAVYQEQHPNRFLANFAKFAEENKQYSYIHQLLYEGFAAFAANHIWSYPLFREIPVHFIGSMAYYFKEVLEEVAFNHKFTVGKVIQRPIVGLVEYERSRNRIQ